MIGPEHIPTTGRKVDYQIKQLGYTSVGVFASSLPENAVVADVGAGLSRLGHEVAVTRPDITWVNIDASYSHPNILKHASKYLPPNVTLFPGDITEDFEMPAVLPAKADIVYSYWLLPHLSLEDTTTAEKACANLFSMLKPGGKLIVGPIKRWGIGLLSPFRYKGTNTYSKNGNIDEAIADIIDKTKLWWLASKVQLFSNRKKIHIGAKFIGGKSKS